MAAILFLACTLVQDKDSGEILSKLTKEQSELINGLDEAKRIGVILALSPRAVPSRSTVSDVNKGELFTTTVVIRINQVVDEQNAIAYGNSLWLSGISTGNLSDGDRISAAGMLWYCSGNKTYATAIGGSKTVMHLHRINPNDSRDVIKQVAEEHGYQVWGAGTPNLIVAKFVKVLRRDVVLDLPTGKQIRVPLKNFSEADTGAINKLQEAD